MSYADNQRTTGALTLAPLGTLCQGSTPYSGSTFGCAGDQGQPAPAVHTWEGRHYCGHHSPFDVTPEERATLDARTLADTAALAHAEAWAPTTRTDAAPELTDWERDILADYHGHHSPLNTTPCPSESLGFGACAGTLIKHMPDPETDSDFDAKFPNGLTECSHCGLTPYTETERTTVAAAPVATLPGVTARLGAPVIAFATEVPNTPAAPLRPAPQHAPGAPQCITDGCTRDAAYDSEPGRDGRGGYFSRCDRCSAMHGQRLHVHTHRFTPAQAAANGGPREWQTTASLAPVVADDKIIAWRCAQNLPYPAPEGTRCTYTEPVDADADAMFTDLPRRGVVYGQSVTVTPVDGDTERWSVTHQDGTLLGTVERTENTAENLRSLLNPRHVITVRYAVRYSPYSAMEVHAGNFHSALYSLLANAKRHTVA